MRVAPWNTQGANIAEDQVNEPIDGLAEEDSHIFIMHEARGQPARAQWGYKGWAVISNGYVNTGAGAWRFVIAIHRELFNKCVGASSGTRWSSVIFRSEDIGALGGTIVYLRPSKQGEFAVPLWKTGSIPGQEAGMESRHISVGDFDGCRGGARCPVR